MHSGFFGSLFNFHLLIFPLHALRAEDFDAGAEGEEKAVEGGADVDFDGDNVVVRGDFDGLRGDAAELFEEIFQKFEVGDLEGDVGERAVEHCDDVFERGADSFAKRDGLGGDRCGDFGDIVNVVDAEVNHVPRLVRVVVFRDKVVIIIVKYHRDRLFGADFAIITVGFFEIFIIIEHFEGDLMIVVDRFRDNGNVIISGIGFGLINVENHLIIKRILRDFVAAELREELLRDNFGLLRGQKTRRLQRVENNFHLTLAEILVRRNVKCVLVPHADLLNAVSEHRQPLNVARQVPLVLRNVPLRKLPANLRRRERLLGARFILQNFIQYQIFQSRFRHNNLHLIIFIDDIIIQLFSFRKHFLGLFLYKVQFLSMLEIIKPGRHFKPVG